MEFIDGHPVVSHRVRFRLRTVVDERFADHIRDGEIIAWVVKARCTPPQYYPTGREADDRYKLAVQDVESAAPLIGEVREAALLYVDGESDQLRLPFYEHEGQEIRAILDEMGEFHEGESIVDAFRRLVAPAAPPAEPEEVPAPKQTGAERYLEGRLEDNEYAEAYARATAVLHEDEPVANGSRPSGPPIALPDDSDVEVVGSIYRGGRSKLAALLDEKFGET